MDKLTPLERELLGALKVTEDALSSLWRRKARTDIEGITEDEVVSLVAARPSIALARKIIAKAENQSNG